MPPKPKPDKPETFGEGLKVARENAGLTTAEAASALGIQEAAWISLEANESRPKFGFLWKLASVLGVRPADLMA